MENNKQDENKGMILSAFVQKTTPPLAGLDECRKVHYGEMSPQHVGGGPRRPSVLPRGRREAAADFSGTTAVKPWGSICR